MAPEKMREGMPTKQKVTIAVVVILLLLVGWQVKEMFGIGKGSTSTTITQASQTPTQATTTAISPSAPPTTTPPQAAVPSTPVSQPTPAATNLQQVSVMEAESSEQQQVQAKYINKINELEDLKIQREIAETNQAIATAKLATVTAEKNISDLLTKPTASIVPTVPPGAYASQLGTPTSPPSSEIPPITKAMTPPPPPEIEYTVISVAMRYGKWNAVIGYQGRLFSVGVGDLLPPDNSIVRTINRNGVTLRKNGKTRKISVVSSI